MNGGRCDIAPWSRYKWAVLKQLGIRLAVGCGLPVLCGCLTGCGLGDCDDVGCRNGYEIRVRLSSSRPLDGAKLDLLVQESGPSAYYACAITLGLPGDCEPANAVSVETGSHGIIVVNSSRNPAKVRVILREGASVLVDKELSPVYKTFEVDNGPDRCDLTCRFAGVMEVFASL